MSHDQHSEQPSSLDGQHITRVVPYGNPPKWVAYCHDCGRLTTGLEDYKGDAEAVAERHHAIGGFEPCS